ncbi:MAG: TonB-dependent receptor [Firmicutes bacterium]|nr:TonB-dependent receptor [Bacillota bacterium]
MRSSVFLWILFGLLFLTTFPVRADCDVEKLIMKVGSSEGKEVEEDLYCYTDWQINNVILKLTNKFSWPQNKVNYSKVYLKTYLEDYDQLQFKIDYQWNDYYRILVPEINYDYTMGKNFIFKLNYQNQNRNPVLDEKQNLKYTRETGTVKMGYGKEAWQYSLKFSQTTKGYPNDQVNDYDQNQLNQELAWRITPNFKLGLSYFEATKYYPDNINLDSWKSEMGIEGEYRINNQWQVFGSYSAKEEEKGLVPYLTGQNLKAKVKSKPLRDLDVSFQVGLADLDFHAELPYKDPDQFLSKDEDLKSRVEKNALVKSCWKYRKSNLTIEAGLFWVDKQYDSPQIAGVERNGLYTTIGWNPGKFGIQLELAPEGNVWRKNGFYQLKMEYGF